MTKQEFSNCLEKLCEHQKAIEGIIDEIESYFTDSGNEDLIDYLLEDIGLLLNLDFFALSSESCESILKRWEHHFPDELSNKDDR